MESPQVRLAKGIRFLASINPKKYRAVQRDDGKLILQEKQRVHGVYMGYAESSIQWVTIETVEAIKP
jgi:hypothetical protein